METLTIVILDHDIDRLRNCENAVQQAIRELGLRAVITQISEPPYLARKNVWDRLPALEINGLIWSLEPGRAFSKEQVKGLLLNKYVQ